MANGPKVLLLINKSSVYAISAIKNGRKTKQTTYAVLFIKFHLCIWCVYILHGRFNIFNSLMTSQINQAYTICMWIRNNRYHLVNELWKVCNSNTCVQEFYVPDLDITFSYSSGRFFVFNSTPWSNNTLT